MIITLAGTIASKNEQFVIIDVHGLTISDPVAMEAKINQIVGVVTNGLFAARPANVLLLATPEGVKTYKK